MKVIRKSLGLILTLMLVIVSSVFVFPEWTEAAVNYQDLKETCSITANVILKKTTGTGQHAKLVIGTEDAAVSFGIQYDQYCGVAKYRGKAAFMFENVRSNSAGGQSYHWVKKAARNKSYEIKLCYNKKGYVWAYVNGKFMGGVQNANLKKKNVTMRCEGAVRLGGEKLDARFKDIVPYWASVPEKSEHGNWAYNSWYGGSLTPSKSALKIKDIGYGVRIYGTASFSGDWDSNFPRASSLIVVY